MNRILPRCMLFLIIGGIFIGSQPKSILVASAADANQVILGIQKRYARATTLAADFVQMYHDRTGRVIREAGSLQLKRPGRMRWEYREPKNKIFLSDGKQTYFYLPLEKRVVIEPVKAGRDPRTPFLFLLGRNNLKEDFSRFELGGESPTKAQNLVIRMWPRRSVENLAEIRVECDPTTFQLARISLLQTSGERSDFLLTNVVENAALADALFTFSAPSDVRVERVGS